MLTLDATNGDCLNLLKNLSPMVDRTYVLPEEFLYKCNNKDSVSSETIHAKIIILKEEQLYIDINEVRFISMDYYHVERFLFFLRFVLFKLQKHNTIRSGK